MLNRFAEPLPAYAYVPGGRWPHPNRSRPVVADAPASPIRPGAWANSRPYLRGVELFNAGYYWEAHEAWEGLWMAHGRRGPTAAVLQGLIKLSAAALKVREGRPRGVHSLASQAADHFAEAIAAAGEHQLGLDLSRCRDFAEAVAADPPKDPNPPGAAVSRVFAFELTPDESRSRAGEA